ncbi:hypothetical protein D3C84_1066220 [compost metagenome]
MRHTSGVSGFACPIFTDTVAMALTAQGQLHGYGSRSLSAQVQLHGYGRSGACATHQGSLVLDIHLHGYGSHGTDHPGSTSRIR